MNDLVCIFVAENPMEAEFVRGFLAGAGLEVELRGQHLFGIRGAIPLCEDTLPSLWVPHYQVAQAEEMLEKVEARAHLRPVEGDPEDDEEEEENPSRSTG